MSLFIPETRLEEALVKAVKHPSLTEDFLRLLLDSDLMVIGTVSASHTGSDGKLIVGQGSEFNLQTGERDGAHFLPLFTSMPRMQAYAKKECKYLSLNGRALFKLTRGAPVVLNPGSEYAQEFTPAEITRLIGPEVTQRTLQSSDAKLPEPLAEALRELFDSHGNIRNAWMILAGPRGGQVTPLVGIETNADFRALMRDIEAMAQNRLPGLVFDVQPIDRARPSGLADVLLQALPFYTQSAPRTLN